MNRQVGTGCRGAAGLLAVLLAVAGLGAIGACDRKTPTPEKKTPTVQYPADKQWTPEEISKDPEAYMQWADAQIQNQVADRERRLGKLESRATELRGRQKELADKLIEIQNLNKRMQTAIRRAEDEDRWPIQLGGRSFDQAKARAVVDQTQKYVQDRTPLVDAYAQAVGKLDGGISVLHKEVEDLGNLREKLSLDLERVRLSQGMEELEGARKRGVEIASYGKALGQIADESLLSTNLPAARSDADRDVESFLK